MTHDNVPIEPEEDHLLHSIRNFLRNDADEVSEPTLAAGVARVFSSYLEDTWVWGVTPRMGWVLGEFADFYDQDFASR
jgi:hypothetical protein